MKKILAMVLSVVLVATLAISGTVAYLTDDESAVNVMTVGKVDIVLHEEQRSEIKPEASAAPELEPFEDNKNLMPLVGSAQGEKDQWGMPIAKNYVDKIVRVENIGESDAYIRIFVGVPSALEESTTGAGENVLHWNLGNNFNNELAGGSSYTTDINNKFEVVAENVVIKENDSDPEVKYNIYSFTIQRAVPADKDEASMTAAAIVGFYLDSRVDYDDATKAYYFGEKVEANRITVNGVGEGNENAASYDFDNGVKIPVFAQAVQADGFENADAAFDAAFDTPYAEANNNAAYHPWTDGTMEENMIAKNTINVNDYATLQAAVDAVEGSGTILLSKNITETQVKIPANKDITITGSSTFEGQFKVVGKLTLKGITVEDPDAVVTGEVSQYSKSAIALVSSGDVVCDGVTFVQQDLNESTAITAWWSTGDGANITVKNCTFNCNGQRPIRSDACVTVENCTFNDPYRYAVQMTSKSSTMAADAEAYVNFKNNTINAGTTTDKPVYGVQLEGGYGCSDLTINGSGNTIDYGTTGKTGTMYYCECGEVDHNTIVWNTEVEPVHETT